MGASTATNLTVSSQIASDANMVSHAISSTSMNNVECKVTDQQIESVSTVSPTDPSKVYSKKLSITYDLKVVHNSKQLIDLYNKEYIDHMTGQEEKIKQIMVDIQVQVEVIFVTIEMSSSAPSVRPSESITTSPTTSPGTSLPSALPITTLKPSSKSISIQTTKPTTSNGNKNTENTPKQKKKNKKKKNKKKKKKKKKNKKKKNKKKKPEKNKKLKDKKLKNENKEKKQKNKPKGGTAPPRPVVDQN